jgi:hypothetical protein
LGGATCCKVEIDFNFSLLKNFSIISTFDLTHHPFLHAGASAWRKPVPNKEPEQ